MVLSFVRDHIYFDDDKNGFLYNRKIRSIFIFEKKHIWYEEDLIHKIISCYMTQTKQTTKQQFMISFFI